MGLGRFGGGLGVTRHLLRQGACVILNDQSSPETLAEPLASLGEHANLKLELGHHNPALLDGVDLLVVNPAVPVPWDHPMVLGASERGIPITTEIEIACRQLNPERVIAITGSAGKSTTCAMAHFALSEIGVSCVLGGNIGGSLLDRVNEITPQTTIVLELSSAMLYWLWGRDHAHPIPHPAVSCVTSYNPNHLDWHGSEFHYENAKKSILHQEAASILPEELSDWLTGNGRVIANTDAISGCAVPGQHNAMNAALAAASIHAMHPEIEVDAIHDAIRSFPGLPHRLHRSLERDGIIYFDDSKSTTPQATKLAVESLKRMAPVGAIHLIAGGYDKGSDLSPIADLAPQLAGLYCIGSTAEKISSQATTNTYLCHTLEHAMECIHTRAENNAMILLSPGCASWDQFENYEQRGNRFIELARSQQGTTA